MVADQIAAGSVQKDIKARLDNWFQWEGGTIPGKDFLALLEKVGFQKVEFIGETGFNSTPKTKGALFRAEKPVWTAKPENSPINTEQNDNKDPNILRKKTMSSIEAVLEKDYAIGCEKAKIIDTGTIIVEK